MLTADEVRELLDYDPETGVLTWRYRPDGVRGWNTKYADKPAGTPNDGYVNINMRGKIYRAHRLAWLHYYGTWPECEIDHRNGVRSDNWIANLRDATRGINCQNLRRAHRGSSVFLGVSWNTGNGKWRADIRDPARGGRTVYLGYFTCELQAALVYLCAKRRLHPGGLL